MAPLCDYYSTGQVFIEPAPLALPIAAAILDFHQWRGACSPNLVATL
ncbi:uncharacterized protein PITG_00547 [Phytophthora infestans T30-4]|uniref:Uncharacterized protein n=1 Tax=Phytophthora infestans (strain T30-4) TaxID=403677 RepID=D0MR31_PHYIT|nr:uncharacterized protein PITG_00547 [Phytophthora infestans T30-4]EEY57950.1 hypothetical protein PITG_00547 [Phytophthora infestans T30-4]|eukprot:XP_002909136.1 hypothetical protein PITG_00547 [Phytophthora infestans T30-4]